MTEFAQVNFTGTQSFSTSGSSPWYEHMAAGLLDGAETVTAPHGLAGLSGRIFRREHNRGTIYRARIRRPRGGTLATNFKGVLFGRYSEDDYWQPIRNKNGNYVVTITCDDTNDVDDGSDYQYTTPDLDAHSWDCDGFNEFVWACETALDIGGGESTSILQGRFI